MIPDLSFQDIFPNEAKLTFFTNNETCRVQVKAGNLLFIIMPNGSQLAFSVENVKHRDNYAELQFTIRRESDYQEWPETATMTLTKTEDLIFEGLIVGEGMNEKIRFDTQP
jgi:ATP-dependent protease Clp ATPase subunit